jgi:hypothetical protein
MENQQSRDDEQLQQQQDAGDEGVEEFKQEVEEDPSTAPSPDENTERLRGG